VPLSSLSLRRTKAQNVTASGGASSQFTRTELAILDRLKLGKANKIIAHELGVSESTVKVHIGRIDEETEGHKSDANRVPRLRFDGKAYAFASGDTNICSRVSEFIISVMTAVRGLAKTEGDDIAECEWCANQEGRGSRMPAARLGTPPLKFRNVGKLPRQ
jgi:DNA-binding CsgD family transcriptional regulator